MKTTLSIAALAAVFAAPALAGGIADPIVEQVIVAPAPVPVMDWTGLYAGVQLGFGDVTLETFEIDDGGDLSADGMIYGVHVGYMRDFGNFVLGVEADYDWTDIGLELPISDIGVLSYDVDYIARLKLRAGFDTGRALLYLTGGPAWMQISATDGVTTVDASDNGYFLGAGVAFLATDRWILGAEVLGHRFDNFDDGEVDIKATTATLRASYKF